MPYDDDDDLFGEEFDFVDDDDSVEEGSELEEEKPKAKPTKKRPAAKDKEKAEKPPARAPKRPRSTSKPAAEKSAPKREPRREEAEPKAAEPRSSESRSAEPRQIPKLAPPGEKKSFDSAPVGYLSFAKDEDFDDEPADVEPRAEAEPRAEVEAAAPAPAEPAGPPADHLVHIYEYGKFKRTIGRKFTDEQAVGFAEEYTRTGKPYGRYAIATPDDEEPSPTFSGASKG
jgi:hypothetical protein